MSHLLVFATCFNTHLWTPVTAQIHSVMYWVSKTDLCYTQQNTAWWNCKVNQRYPWEWVIRAATFQNKMSLRRKKPKADCSATWKNMICLKKCKSRYRFRQILFQGATTVVIFFVKFLSRVFSITSLIQNQTQFIGLYQMMSATKNKTIRQRSRWHDWANSSGDNEKQGIGVKMWDGFCEE